MNSLSLKSRGFANAFVVGLILLLAWLRKRRSKGLPALSTALLQVYPQISSLLTKHQPRSIWRSERQAFSSFCPCCRRPLEIKLLPEPRPQGKLKGSSPKRHAYVALIYGSKPSSARYALGALGLAEALQRTGSTVDRVLMHTSDVPAEVLQALQASGLWKLQEVKYLHGVEMLGKMTAFGWYGIFTKLRLFGLVQYSKVVFLDLDTFPRKSLDGLFDLEAPAAMLKATGYYWQPEHGDCIDGRRFFPTEAWNSPHGGINAGVMVFEPDKEIEALMEKEVTDMWHPEHIYAQGPEQEYLSRFFADRWRHIHSRFNFQIFRLDPTEPLMKFDVKRHSEGGQDTLRAVMDEIVAPQFSSSPKPWDFALSESLGNLQRDVRDSLISKWKGDGKDNTDAAARALLLQTEEQLERWPLQARLTFSFIEEFLQCQMAAEQRIPFEILQAFHALCAQAPASTVAKSRMRST